MKHFPMMNRLAGAALAGLFALSLATVAPAQDQKNLEGIIEALRQAAEAAGDPDSKAAAEAAIKDLEAQLKKAEPEKKEEDKPEQVAEPEAEPAEPDEPAKEDDKEVAEKDAKKPEAPAVKVEAKPGGGAMRIEIKGGGANAKAVVRVVGGDANVHVQQGGGVGLVLNDLVLEPGFLRGEGAEKFLDVDAEGEAPKRDVLRFMRNGDRLQGDLVTLTGDGQSVIWTNDWSPQPITFDIKGVASAELRPREVEGRVEHPSAVQLTNEDTLTGVIKSLNEDHLVMDTWYAGELTIHRAMLRALNPNANRSLVLFAGPGNIDDWTHGANNKAWRIKGDALVPSRSGTIGRNIENLPNRVKIKFKAAWTQYANFSLNFGSDEVGSTRGNSYMLSIRSSSFSLTRFTTDEGSSSMWSFHDSNFSSSRSSEASYQIMYDKEKKTFALAVNDKVVKQWTEPNRFAGKGNGIVFSVSSQLGLRLSDIEVTEWDGKLPKQEKEDAPKEDPATDQVYFANGDRVVGKVVEIGGGKMKFKTEFATVDIPLERVTEIVFAKEFRERARRNKGDIRATFVERGVLTVQLQGMEGGDIVGKSENFGEVKLPLNAFRKIDFNIYDDKDEVEDDDFPF